MYVKNIIIVFYTVKKLSSFFLVWKNINYFFVCKKISSFFYYYKNINHFFVCYYNYYTVDTLLTNNNAHVGPAKK